MVFKMLRMTAIITGLLLSTQVSGEGRLKGYRSEKDRSQLQSLQQDDDGANGAILTNLQVIEYGGS